VLSVVSSVALSIAFISCCAAHSAAASRFDLSDDERVFIDSIKDRPITILCSYDLLYFSPQDGGGMIEPFLELLRELGLSVEVKKTGLVDALQAVRDGDGDFYGLISLSDHRVRDFYAVGTVFRSYVQFVTRRGAPLGSVLALRDKRIGLLPEDYLSDGVSPYLYPDGRAIFFSSVAEMVYALEEGAIDCFLTTDNAEVEILRRGTLCYEFADQNLRSNQGFVTMKDELRPLVEILNRHLDSAGPDMERAIEDARREGLLQSARERMLDNISAVNARYGEIRIFDSGELYPFSFIENGERAGLLSEINHILGELTGLEVVIDDADYSHVGITSAVDMLRAGDIHFVAGAYVNPRIAGDATLSYSTPIWVDNIRSYAYSSEERESAPILGATEDEAGFVRLGADSESRLVFFSTRRALMDALETGETDIAFASEMLYNYYYAMMNRYGLLELGGVGVPVEVRMIAAAGNAELNELFNEAVALHQAIYPHARDYWKQCAEWYRYDHIKLKDAQRSILYSVAIVVALMIAIILLSLNRYVKYDRQISRLIRKQSTFDLVWGNLKNGRYISKGDHQFFRNRGFDLAGPTCGIDDMSRILGWNLREDFAAELKGMKERGCDMTVSQKMLVSPMDGKKMHYRRFIHYLNDHEFMECLQDVTDDVNKVATLSTAASTDFLSALLTRRAMNEKLLQKCVELQQNGGRTFLVMFDIDDFKKVNDSYGHDAGDEVLKSVSSIIKSADGCAESTSRWGGEEFLAMMDRDDLERALKTAEEIIRIVEAMEVRIEGTGKVIKVTISAGLAELDPFKHYNVSVQLSDKALYEAKNSGKNRVCVRTSDLKMSALRGY
jgi:diguanylate cyclase (GGDEF)-like protein